jgi:hypothetical protein
LESFTTLSIRSFKKIEVNEKLSFDCREMSHSSHPNV